MRTVLRSSALLLALAGLVACVDPEGQTTGGGASQSEAVTPEVLAATRDGIEACVDALSSGQPLSGLDAKGFVLSRTATLVGSTLDTYTFALDNGTIWRSKSEVRVHLYRTTSCYIDIDPVATDSEIGAIETLVNMSVAKRGADLYSRMTYTRQYGRFEIVIGKR